jgi:hypothetical protein
MKKEKGRSPARLRLRSKLCFTSMMMEFKMLVINEIAKKITNTSITMW